MRNIILIRKRPSDPSTFQAQIIALLRAEIANFAGSTFAGASRGLLYQRRFLPKRLSGGPNKCHFGEGKCYFRALKSAIPDQPLQELPRARCIRPCTFMHLFPKLHISHSALLISRLFRRPLSSQRMPEGSQEELSAFQQDAKAIDPKVLATAMGGIDEPPEEPLLSTFEEGHGYFTAAAVGRSLRQYEFVRKVRMCGLPRLNLF